MKAVIYQKMNYLDLSDPKFNPFDIELHYWTVEAETDETALELLERRWDIPWRDWLVGIVELENLHDWLVAQELQDVKIHASR